MFILANVVIATGTILHGALNAYMWIIIIGSLLTWVNPDPYNPIVRFFRIATGPVLSWFRRRLPLQVGAIDLSPLVVIAIIVFLDQAVAKTIIEAGYRMKMPF